MKPSIFFKLFIFIIFMTGIPSCEKDCECCHDGPVYYDARITDFQVDGIYIQTIPTDWEYYWTGDTVNVVEDLVIKLKSYYEAISFRAASPGGGLFMNTAYACSPLYSPSTEQEFIRLTISSTEEYDPNHPAGSDLIDLFVTNSKQAGGNDQKIPLTQYLAINADDFILNSSFIYLKKSPEHISEHTFKFELELSDTIFTFQTPEIILR